MAAAGDGLLAAAGKIKDMSDKTIVSQPKEAQLASRKLSLQAVRRSVASSTAVETGQSVAQLEAKLARHQRRFSHITLAR